MRLLVCGNRDWTCKETIAAWLRHIGDGRYHTLIHGAALGADVCAAMTASRLGWRTEAYPARWDKHGIAAGPIRNQEMLESKPDRCLAFGALYRGTKRTGTGDMVMRCNAVCVPVTVVPRPGVMP